MAQFYIKSNEDVRICERSKECRERITIAGINESGEIQAFTGIVQFVERFLSVPQGRRARVTILD
jgi:hypothetical protein